LLSLSNHEKINEAVLQAYGAVRDEASLRRTHYFHGRYENIYINVAKMPALQPVIDRALQGANAILASKSLKFGFWFNEMGPGHLTTRHNHDDLDELLSCVYYIRVPNHCGNLLLHHNEEITSITPVAGQFVYFDPMVDHEVMPNCSDEMRLAVAFNFGPA